MTRAEVRRLNLSPWQRHALRTMATAPPGLALGEWDALRTSGCQVHKTHPVFHRLEALALVRRATFRRYPDWILTDLGREAVVALDAARQEGREPEHEPEHYMCVDCGRRTTACQCNRGGNDGE